jgi:DNA-binding GntR family transcriptional regulator
MTIALRPGAGNGDIMSLDARMPLHEEIYRTLRERLASGALRPGEALSLRRLAADLGGSITPVRDAVWRLAAEHALEFGPTRRITVPVIGSGELAELMAARRLLEPEAAVQGLAGMTPERIGQLRRHEASLMAALQSGDIAGYMAANHGFHFTLYRAGGAGVLVPLIESLWVRFGPFMRHAFADAVAASSSAEPAADTHTRILAAVEAGDAAALAQAVRDDVLEGEAFLRHGLAAD